MNIINIIETMADGPGIRTSVYVAGCKHYCDGCHNPETWRFDQGQVWDPIKLGQHLLENKYNNITFSGGDPIYQIDDLIACCKYIKEHSDKDIWVYTGFELEELKDDPKYIELTKYVDTMVFGRFVKSLRDTSLKFRGSSNQRIIKL